MKLNITKKSAILFAVGVVLTCTILFVACNKENAEKYIQQVLAFKNADSLDWVNGGHIALLNGNLNLAIERYQNAEPDDVLFSFIDDNDKMVKAGITKEDITLTYELLNRKINS